MLRFHHLSFRVDGVGAVVAPVNFSSYHAGESPVDLGEKIISGFPVKTPYFLHFSPLAAIGGCEFNCLRIIEGLAGHLHRVVVFGERGPMSGKWEAAGARVEHLGAWHNGSQAFEAALADWAGRQDEPSGVFCWSTSRLPVVLKVLRRWGAAWGVYLGNPVAGGVVPALRRLAQEQMHPAPRAITLVACSNHVAASHRHASYFRRFSTTVIYNAVPSVLDRTREHRALPLGSGPRVGMVARLDSIKDHATVIRALASIASVRPDIIVEFAGDGELRGSLQNEARRLGVAERVRFLGFSDVSPLLAAWDVYVHSTTAAEGMGTAVAEAMMSGLPCLVSDLAVMREVCGDSGAVFAPAGDAAALGRGLLQLLDDRAGRESLGQCARARARQLFALPQVADAYLQVVSPDPASKGS